MHASRLIALLALSLALAGCVQGHQSGAVVAAEATSPTEAPATEPIIVGEAEGLLFTIGETQATATPATAEAAEAASAATASPTATLSPSPTPSPTPKPSPTPTPSPTPSFSLPPVITGSGAPSNSYVLVCGKQGPTCDEFTSEAFTSGFSTYYPPSNADHAKDSRYFFITTNNLGSVTRIMLQKCAKYHPGENTFGVYGYGTEFKNTC